MSLLRRLPLVPRGALLRQAERADRYKDWYASAMVMVDNQPSAVVWADAAAGFRVTYANAAARRLLHLDVEAFLLEIAEPLRHGIHEHLFADADVRMHLDERDRGFRLDGSESEQQNSRRDEQRG